jgi:uncharacterized membrane protein
MSDQSIAATGYDSVEGKGANLVYILYLVGLIVGITSLVGLIMAYINRGDAPDWVKTHYRYQIRTFWIGLLYGAVGLITIPIVIGFVILLLVAIWWIVRCAKGLKSIGEGQPAANPATWMW